jgi:hypothetical protein
MRDLYQTDFGGYKQRDGCLLFTIFKAATDIAGNDLSHNRCNILIDRLNTNIHASYNSSLTVLSAEDDNDEPGVFVWDHEAVFNEVFITLGSHWRMKYTARIYMPWEMVKGHVCFDNRHGVDKHWDLVIMQIKTKNGNGHFRLANWDPWQPGTEMADLKSLRYYRLWRV